MVSWEWQRIPFLPALQSEKGIPAEPYGSRLIYTEVTRPLPGLRVKQCEAVSLKGQPQTNRHMHSVYFPVNISNTEAFSSGVSIVLLRFY